MLSTNQEARNVIDHVMKRREKCKCQVLSGILQEINTICKQKGIFYFALGKLVSLSLSGQDSYPEEYRYDIGLLREDYDILLAAIGSMESVSADGRSNVSDRSNVSGRSDVSGRSNVSGKVDISGRSDIQLKKTCNLDGILVRPTAYLLRRNVFTFDDDSLDIEVRLYLHPYDVLPEDKKERNRFLKEASSLSGRYRRLSSALVEGRKGPGGMKAKVKRMIALAKGGLLLKGGLLKKKAAYDSFLRQYAKNSRSEMADQVNQANPEHLSGRTDRSPYICRIEHLQFAPVRLTDVLPVRSIPFEDTHIMLPANTDRLGLLEKDQEAARVIESRLKALAYFDQLCQKHGLTYTAVKDLAVAASHPAEAFCPDKVHPDRKKGMERAEETVVNTDEKIGHHTIIIGNKKWYIEDEYTGSMESRIWMVGMMRDEYEKAVELIGASSCPLKLVRTVEHFPSIASENLAFALNQRDSRFPGDNTDRIYMIPFDMVPADYDTRLAFATEIKDMAQLLRRTISYESGSIYYLKTAGISSRQIRSDLQEAMQRYNHIYKSDRRFGQTSDRTTDHGAGQMADGTSDCKTTETSDVTTDHGAGQMADGTSDCSARQTSDGTPDCRPRQRSSRTVDLAADQVFAVIDGKMFMYPADELFPTSQGSLFGQDVPCPGNPYLWFVKKDPAYTEYLAEKRTQVMKIFDDLTQTNGIDYFAMSNLLIGTVIYHDVMPQSDQRNMDIGLLRKDFDAFLKLMRTKGKDAEIELHEYLDDQGKYPLEVKYLTMRGHRYSQARIRILPFDKVPEDFYLYQGLRDDIDAKNEDYHQLLRLYNAGLTTVGRLPASMDKDKKEALMKADPRVEAAKIEKLARSFNDDDRTSSYMWITFGKSKIITEDELFPLQRVAFRDIMVSCPRDTSVWQPVLDAELERQVSCIQKTDLYIMQVFDEVCRKLGTGYFVCGGTMLGYMRHGGFIPWDDDVDVAMLREDYDRFMKEAGPFLPDRFFLQTRQTDPDIPYLFSKIRLDDTEYVTKYNEKRSFHKGICLDIFPFDYLPEDEEERKAFVDEVKSLAAEHHLIARRQFPIPEEVCQPRNEQEKRYIREQKTLLEGYWEKDLAKSQQAYLDAATRYNARAKESGLRTVASFVPDYTYIDLNDLLPYQRGKFEDIEVSVPKRPDVFLTMQYGDYMRLPPKHMQVAHRLLRWKTWEESGQASAAGKTE